MEFPKHSLTLIVKSMFNLVPGIVETLSEDQLFPTGDEYYPDDEDMVGGPNYASDFAYFKPKADLLLVGKCYTPDGKKVPSTNVKFQVASYAKTLNIVGNRYWVGRFNTATKPELFSEFELRYENSYGGKGYKKNPVGKGIDKVEIKTGDKLVPLPNILHYGENISSRNIELEPAGFGPYGQIWLQRFSKLGTYKGNYLKERWPWFPKDFDWGYFNAAPVDMQVSGYLRGDEKLYFENLHPVHAQYHSQLPGLRVRCFLNELNEKNSDASAKMNFNEVKMNLDTLWVDMETEKLILVWRGITEIRDEDFEEIKHIYIVSEKLEEQPQTVDHYQKMLEKELIEPEEEEFSEPEPVVEKENAEDVELEEEIAKAEVEMKASLIEAGIDPDNPPELSEEDKRKEAQMLMELGIKEENEEVPFSRELFIKRANNKESFEGEDLRGIDLSGLDLQGLNFRNAILSGVSLKNSDLSMTNLAEANLSEADLSESKLNAANLKEADLTDAILIKADLAAAVIEDAMLEKAKLNNAILIQVKGKDAIFSGAELKDAILTNSDFTGCDFSNSIMDNANFKGCNLSEVSLEGASGIQADFSETNLSGLKASEGCNFKKASFQKAKGFDSIWEKANLSESDFSFSEMEGANFSLAIMEKANLYASNMKFARFIRTNLTNAFLKEMNLFQGSLEKANLTDADCSKSNFYAAEFLDAILKNTKFQFANLKMTKLATRY